MSESLLFVCGGNTCRSPLAAAMAAVEGVEATSAGIDVAPGLPASEHARAAGDAAGLDLSAHRTQAVDAVMMEQADAVYAMTAEQAEVLRTRWPQHAAKVDRLDPDADIADPYGGSLEHYEAIRDGIHAALAQRLDSP